MRFSQMLPYLAVAPRVSISLASHEIGSARVLRQLCPVLREPVWLTFRVIVWETLVPSASQCKESPLRLTLTEHRWHYGYFAEQLGSSHPPKYSASYLESHLIVMLAQMIERRFPMPPISYTASQTARITQSAVTARRYPKPAPRWMVTDLARRYEAF